MSKKKRFLFPPLRWGGETHQFPPIFGGNSEDLKISSPPLSSQKRHFWPPAALFGNFPSIMGGKSSKNVNLERKAPQAPKIDVFSIISPPSWGGNSLVSPPSWSQSRRPKVFPPSLGGETPDFMGGKLDFLGRKLCCLGAVSPPHDGGGNRFFEGETVFRATKIQNLGGKLFFAH